MIFKQARAKTFYHAPKTVEAKTFSMPGHKLIEGDANAKADTIRSDMQTTGGGKEFIRRRHTKKAAKEYDPRKASKINKIRQAYEALLARERVEQRQLQTAAA